MGPSRDEAVRRARLEFGGTRANQGRASRRQRDRRPQPPRSRSASRPSSVPPVTGLQRTRRAVPRARHRREHVDLRRPELSAPPADAGAAARATDRRQPRRHRQLLVSDLPRVPRSQPYIVWTHGLDAERIRPRHRRQQHIRRRGGGVGELLDGDRRANGAWALVLERRGAGGGDQLRRLATSVQSRPQRAGTNDSLGIAVVLDRGCRAARVQRDLLAASNGPLGTDRHAAITRRAAGRQDSSNTDALRTVG